MDEVHIVVWQNDGTIIGVFRDYDKANLWAYKANKKRKLWQVIIGNMLSQLNGYAVKTFKVIEGVKNEKRK